MAGLVVAMRSQVSSPSPVVHRPTSSQTTTVPNDGLVTFHTDATASTSVPSLPPTGDTPRQ
jgi:hypothetical protein